jgi:hypothetical protein
MAYSDEEKIKIFDDICEKVVGEQMSFNKAIDDSPITLTTFYKWLKADEQLQKAYNYAREIRADILFEDIIDIADNQEEGEEVELDGAGVVTKIKRGDMIRQRQLKIDARKWTIAKMQPKKYGDKLDITSKDEKINNGFPTLEQFYGKVEKSDE